MTNNRAKQRVTRIKEEIPIVDVLVHYGYHVHAGGGDTEMQFQCDLHGDGRDNKPSARVYPESASFYCFACSKVYDAVDLVQIKENLNFGQACRFLEKAYDLPTLPWEGDDYVLPAKPEDEIAATFQRSRSYEEDRDRISNLLMAQTQDKILALSDIAAMWELFDRISWCVGEGHWTENKGLQAFSQIRKKVYQKENGQSIL